MGDFVTSQITKKLKEKGFPIKSKEIIYGDNGVFIPTPTIYQILKWLREEKRIDAGAIWYNNDKVWIGYVNKMDMSDLVSDCVLPHNSYDSYEGASMSAIEYVLDNLI